jgi:hypothetical protein
LKGFFGEGNISEDFEWGLTYLYNHIHIYIYTYTYIYV